MSAITPCLWFDGDAEEAAAFYVSLLPDSRIDNVMRSPADTPSGAEGSVLTVEFTLAGQRFVGLNGGPHFRFNEAVSFMVDCADQAEVDRLWDALSADESAEQCGWLKDRFGLSWQIIPDGSARAARRPRSRQGAPRHAGDAGDEEDRRRSPRARTRRRRRVS